MRITFVLPHANLAGGVRVIVAFAKQLMGRGHEVLAVSEPAPRLSLKERLRSLLMGRGWGMYRPVSPSHLDGSGVPHIVLDAARTIVDADVPDADVIVATWWGTACSIAQLSDRKGAKAHFVQLDERMVFPEQAEWVKGVEAAWRLPTYKIATSNCVRDAVAQVTHQTDIPVVVNGVDRSRFFASPRGLHTPRCVGVLYSDAFCKGFDTATAVLQEVRRHLPDLKIIVLTAQAPPRPALLPDGVRLEVRPPQDELRAIYAECDVWLCTSRYEGFHLVPMEAMACRCPVVSTRVGGPMDMIEDGINGYIADVGDVATLAERVLRVLRTSDEQWAKMSSSALATAQRYTWEAASLQFEQQLTRAMSLAQARNSGPICAAPTVATGDRSDRADGLGA